MKTICTYLFCMGCLVFLGCGKRQSEQDSPSSALVLEQKTPPLKMKAKKLAENLKEEFNEIKTMADSGDAEAQFQLAKMYGEGRGVEKDFGEFIIWMRKSAEQKNPKAQFQLALQLKKGIWTPKYENELSDLFEASKVGLRKLAEAGDSEAQISLGAIYTEAGGVEQDYKEAFKWYRKASEKGNHRAQTALGMAYARGQGVEQDYEQAIKWYRKAADQGSPMAQYTLGGMFAKGHGVEQNFQEAAKWWRKAAEQNLPFAYYSLGVMYLTSQGVQKDYKTAFDYISSAAEHNLPIAQYQLASMYSKGIGVKENDREAVRWLNVAAENGFEPAKEQLANIKKNSN